jgi:hypothetical protein
MPSTKSCSVAGISKGSHRIWFGFGGWANGGVAKVFASARRYRPCATDGIARNT